MQVTKKQKRLKRAKKTRMRIKTQSKPRLVVTKSNKHIYAQIIESNSDVSDKVIAFASTVEKSFAVDSINLANQECAKKIGSIIAERALKHNIKEIAFDRSGYKYHGSIKALADSAREAGLSF